MKTRNRVQSKTQRSSSQPYNTSSVGKRLFVGNLSFDVTWQDLKDFCKSVGRVVRADVEVDDSGKSKGFGLVEYSSSQDAENAIEELNGRELKGRAVNIREDRENKNTGNRNEKIQNNSVGRRLYVGNLAYEVSWQDLKDHFKTIGNVLYADVLRDQDNNRSKGCGIVEFSSADEARQAIRELNDSDLRGRPIFVREDREEKPGNIKGKQTKQSFISNSSDVGNTVYVGNLSFDVTWQDLKDHMRQSGDVVRADVMQDDSGKSKGCGLVEFSSSKDALRAIRQLNDTELRGRPIFIREDREQQKSKAATSTTTFAVSEKFKASKTKTISIDESLPSARGGGEASMNIEESVGGNGCKIYVGNLSFDTTWQKLKDHFRNMNAGEIVHVDILTNSNGKSKGTGIVECSDPTAAQEAIAQLNESTLDGRKLNVREYRDK